MSSHKRPVQPRMDSDVSSSSARDLTRPGQEEGAGLLIKLMELPVARMSRQQLKRLEEHQYSSAGCSLLDPVMQGYWCWLVSKVPLWMAPNLITIVGLATNIISTLILVYYCPTATEQAPTWAYLACALGLFIYQSLDAIDGKQARRTNSSTPLGELFDHGCDSLSTVFVVLGTCIAVQLGTHPDWMFFCCFVGIFMFYCAHWQAYVSGTLRFGIIDVTEVQIYIISLYLLAAFGGTALWQFVIPVINIQIKIIPALCTLVGAIFSCTNYFRVIFSGGMGKNGSTIAGTSVLSPSFHIGVLMTLALMIYKKSSVQLFEKHPCLYILAFGFVSGKLTNRLVVAHMTKSEMHCNDSAFVGPALLFLNQYFNSFINEYCLLWVALVVSGFDLVRYCVSVCNQIATHLNICVFSIQPPTTSTLQPECKKSPLTACPLFLQPHIHRWRYARRMSRQKQRKNP
ncbi:choline/ethanolaminephosphotransferase 1-like isoform X1 [Myxocyprinus asiaticus]|uniref:choline/ethanolaminephosphotransferase 1-like isoform X1 n=1 Tax=Myxocyprinus asiaticus TaxID=70543 RepID=UPI0022238A6F|nr:choline/ethanolaminephosphotransferase 1-like isoform X1 [Myxocyprinus asiaticus]XP_051524184.1 choline/ethanolaminephosphotransferase 1-like isoform X1 [Myxocyprinus asiaticus]XP_051524185.1 choline/ethanolaminephosphotransferase 1-like isoform X1 [Myxocyprinus asiaticus]